MKTIAAHRRRHALLGGLAVAATMLVATPARALDSASTPETKVLDCKDATTRDSCVECGADPGIYCCIAGLHVCDIKNPPPPPPPPQPSRWAPFPTIRRGLGSATYFSR